jgi:hypothetical protein
LGKSRHEREEIARTRIVRLLDRHGIANARTIEQKISDAGPFGQRIDPHILTGVRNALAEEGVVQRAKHASVDWYFLTEANPDFVQYRLDEQLPTYQAVTHGTLATRLGQTLEIATYRALAQTDFEYYGRFKDLDAHDDSTMYSKEEPPQHIGKRSLSGNQRLDFIVRHDEAKSLGIECKNVREWLYPDRSEIKETLQKCVTLDCVPVLIARRIPFVSFKVLNTCGVIIHQVYNQLFPGVDAALAAQARDKNLLGYHDVREGNAPDARLLKFIQENLPAISSEAREKFDEYSDLLASFAGGMDYEEFAARVRRRSQGANEDHDWPDEEPQE